MGNGTTPYFQERISNIYIFTAPYYYWLQCEPHLQSILPAIHAVHFNSTKAWNAMAQSLRPMHLVRTKDNDQGLIGKRRRTLQQAMSTVVDIGSLLRRAVRMYAEPVYQIDKVADRLNAAWQNLQQSLNAHAEFRILSNASEGHVSESIFPQVLPIMFLNKIPINDKIVYCALPLSLIEFITYECLCNALSYYLEETIIDMVVTLRRETNGRPLIVVRIENYRDLSLSSIDEVKSSGILACRVAAQAAQGKFESIPIEDGQRWQAIVEIPLHEVPIELEGELHDLLSNR